MRNLLSANFLRFRQNRVLWGGMAVMLLYGLTRVSSLRQTLDNGGSSYFPPFHFLELIPFVLAVYCCASNAAEFDAGAVRNKLTVGAARPAVYLTDLIDHTAAAFLFCAAYILPTWGLDWVLFHDSGVLEYPRTTGETAVWLLVGLAAVASYSALFTFLGMNVQGRASGAAAIVLLAAALVFLGHRSETAMVLHWQDSVGWPLEGPTLVWHTLFSQWLPGGQAVFVSQYSDRIAPGALAVRALAVAALTTGIGILLFRRKDLK